METQEVISDQEVGEFFRTDEDSDSGMERRRAERFAYNVVQSMAPFDGTNLPKKVAFCQVYIHDLSTTGISFLLPQPPDFEYVVVALGKSPTITYLTARVVNHRPAKKGVFVGCAFLAKVEL